MAEGSDAIPGDAAVPAVRDSPEHVGDLATQPGKGIDLLLRNRPIEDQLDIDDTCT